MTEVPTEKQIIETYQKLNRELQMIGSKLIDLDSKAQEHQLVYDALQPLDKDRKCCRLVGGVLVERTVSEVLPVLQTNGAQLTQAAAQHKELLERKRKELAEFQTKWKIRVRNSGAPDQDEAASTGGTGVLVEKN